MRSLGMILAVSMWALVGCGGGSDHDVIGPYVCDADGCVCEGESICDGECGDGCDLACVDSSDCDVVCDDSCTMLCDSVSTCTVDCGLDCDVTCLDLSTCTVTMITGQAYCENVSECDIGCWVGDDVIEPAIDEGDGWFVCL